jgi:ISXO2 transposase-like protein
MKTGMRGVYKKVSAAYLQNYLDEYAWRHNAKREPSPLFTQLLNRAAEGKRARA